MDRRIVRIDILRGFGARLRELRHAAGLSQEALALQADLDRSYVGQVERGERNITVVNIHRLALVLSVPPSQLLEQVARRGAAAGEVADVPQ